ncbi:MAG: PH domain-containing protein [Bacteroidales bacterium]|nr:PH domain-containing protein [Bacteroidales bacterium]
MKTFKSKIDWWIYLALAILFGVLIFAQLHSNKTFVTTIIFSLIFYFTALMSLGISYTIQDGKLMLKAAFINLGDLEISKITKIQKTSTILSAPAASLDRIALYEGKKLVAVISPKERQEFFDALREINPDIVIEL